jgi:glycosyltransferase involved in cell wall biosynthesis
MSADQQKQRSRRARGGGLPGHHPVVVIDATAVHPRSGGAGTYLRALVSALGESGAEPVVLARRSDPTPWAGAARVHRVAPNQRVVRLIWEQIGLVWAIRRLQLSSPVVLHSPHYTTPLIVPRWLRRVVTVHDLTFFTHPEHHHWVKRYFFRAAIRLSQRADAVVAVSRTTALAYAEQISGDVPTFVAQHGVDHERFCPGVRLTHEQQVTERQELERLGVRHPFVLFLGTIEPRKNVDALIRAMQLHTLRDTQLVLAGQTWTGYVLPTPGTNERRLGWVTDDLAAALLRAASVVVYPSAAEGFGMPIIEALACDTPVIVTDLAVFEEVVGDAGITVPLEPASSLDDRLATAITEVLGERLEPGQVAQLHRRERAALFTWTAAAAIHRDAYAAAASTDGRIER